MRQPVVIAFSLTSDVGGPLTRIVEDKRRPKAVGERCRASRAARGAQGGLEPAAPTSDAAQFLPAADR
jgi:hypothetical protein